ncbi:MAG TPA: CopD family protein [Hyphomonadaceae bacterium]|nr:CopD family protein [Hyphomonadaceae bacterium]
MADAATPWLAAVAIGFDATALIAIGLALHATFVVEAARVRGYLFASLVAAILAFGFAIMKLALVSSELGAGFADAFNLSTLGLAWSALARADLALAIGTLLIAAGAAMRLAWLASVGALTMAAAFGLTGHTQGITNPAEAPAIVALHVVIAAFWVAAPISLRPSRTISDPDLMTRLARFSTLAVVAIPVLVLAGLWLAFRILGGLEPLVSTPYGKLILAKLAAAILAIGMGALNKTMIPNMIARDGAHGRRWLHMTLTVETISFAAAILAVALATTAWPPAE